MSIQSRPAAMLEIVSGTHGRGDKLRYEIRNTGSMELICGTRYRLEWKTGDEWVHMNPGMAFRAIGFGVRPGEDRELAAVIPIDAPPGTYRISTSVTADGVEGALQLSASFELHS